jgi:GntR family transcriptional regulator/MocR family aminotransferase
MGALLLGTPPAGAGLQRWLYEVLRQAILAGRMPAHSSLPGTRTLALQHGLSRGTVQAAYNQLVSEGYLVARTGSATRVSQVLPDLALRAAASAATAATTATAATADLTEPPQPLAGAVPLPVQGRWLGRLAHQVPAFPLADGTAEPRPFLPHRCDVSAFPIDIWRKLHVRHLRPSRVAALWQADAAGDPALRAAIAAHLALARGVVVQAEQIVVLGSVQQALDLCLRLLVEPGESVWMEDPGYMGARQLMLAAGVAVHDVAVDQDGMRVEQAMRHAPAARLAYVTPSRQAPLGVALSPERRLALLNWAVQAQACIFEDDYDSDYRFVARPIPALKSLPGGATHVVLAGTFSKLLFPALRLAYVALPAHLVEPFKRAASLSARHANGLAQAVLADFMAEGHFDRHVRRMRKIYAARAQAFEHAAQRHWQGLIEVPAVQAGLDVVGRLVSLDEASALRRLAAAGIEACPLSRYGGSGRLADALVMGFAPFDEGRIEQAARQVARALRREV